MSKKNRSFGCPRYCTEQLASCLKKARLQDDPLDRLAFVQMAAHWRDFAQECEQKGHPWASWCQRKREQASTNHANQSLLSRLPQHLLADLFNRTTPVRLRANEVLFLVGDAGDGCYRVDDGLLKVTMVSRSGSERILAFLGPGAIVGELSVIDGKPRSASVVAVRATVLSFLSHVAFDDFASRHPEIYKSLVMLLAARLRETDTAIAAGSFLPLKGRVASTLLELAEDFGQDVGCGRIVIRQKIGQSDLAAMAGIARENVSRILNDWQRRKLVSRLSGYYCLENKALLQAEAEL